MFFWNFRSDGASGQYTCDNGDNVSFSIGDIPIGAVVAQAGIVTPYSFFPNNQEAALNLARLLQSLDTNTSDNVITFDSNSLGLLGVNTDFQSPTFVADAESDLGIVFVSVEDAQTQLNDTIVSMGESVPDGANIPIAVAGNDQNVHNGDLVTLDGSASSDADGDSLTYLWSVSSKPVGSNATLSNATVVNPSFVTDESGDYNLTLVVNDGGVDSQSDEVIIVSTQGNAAPVANAGIDQNVNTTDIVELNASTSSDADGDSLTYLWNITSKPATSIAALSDTVIVNPTFEADLDGDYNISLVVNDGSVDSNMDTIIVTATTLNAAPVAHISVDEFIATNLAITLDGSGSLDANSDSLTYLWNITSKPIGSTATFLDATVEYPELTVDLVGAYVVSLVVNDGTIDSNNTASEVINSIQVDAVATHNTFDYVGIVSPYTGKIWLDRNLGADRVCTAYNDTSCFGDYYQWGRDTDGHEKTTAAKTTTQAADIYNAGSAFIMGNDNIDWVESGLDGTNGFVSIDLNGALRFANWSKTDGTSVCPVDYRVPTSTELIAETTAMGASNQLDVFNGFLKFPSVGYRYYAAGDVINPGEYGAVWSTTAKSLAEAYHVEFTANSISSSWAWRARGNSIRCIKNY